MTTPTRTYDLRALLHTYAPSDPGELAFKTRMLGLLEVGDAALSRGHWAPGHFTASSFVLNPRRDAVALVLHKKLGIWVQPGGHIERSDADVQSAALREATEELGLLGLTAAREGLFDVDIHSIPARKEEPAHQHFDLRFVFVAHDDALRPTDEVQDAQWVKLDALERFATDASVRRAAAKLLG